MIEARRLGKRLASGFLGLALVSVATLTTGGMMRASQQEPAKGVPPKDAGPAANSDVRQNILDLEPAVGQAELILAVRLKDVTETKIVHGGRNVEVTQQYVFEPARVLKGIFASDTLLMTGQDLNIYRFAQGTDRLEPGQLMLILLGRQGANYFNCNWGTATLAQSIPRLSGLDDPLLTSVDTLIAVTRRRDVVEKVNLLRDGLAKATGRAAETLLQALGRRALLASQTPGIVEAIAPHLKSRSPGLREVAARTLGALLTADPAAQAEWHARAGRVLVEALDASGPDVAARVALIQALGSAGEVALRDEAVQAWTKADRPASTFAETAARFRALGRLRATERLDEVRRAYETLPLDAPTELEDAAGSTLVAIDGRAAVGLISARVKNKSAAALKIGAELGLLAQLPADLAVPVLVQAADLPLDFQEKLAFAQACEKVADPRLVPALGTLLDPRTYQVRSSAIATLMKIQTEEAASVLRPHLDEEADLNRKLEMITFLGRHGIRDGYSQAIEHLSQPVLRDAAVEALAAVREPKAIPELRRIWQTSNDLNWNASAIRALARLEQADIAPRLLEIARDPADPLADSALIGLGDLGRAEALPIVLTALDSRSDALVIAAVRSAGKLLSRPGLGAALDSNEVRDKLAALLIDTNAAVTVRHAALEALKLLSDRRLGPALAVAARDSQLEGTPFLARIEQELTKRRQPVEFKAD